MPTFPSRIRPVGDRAVLVELDSLPEVMCLQSALLLHPLDGQVDVVAAAGTVLVTAASAPTARDLARQLRLIDVSAAGGGTAGDALVRVDVIYDGADLDEVGALTGLGRDGVIAAHTEQVWTAAFGGFAPGFAYLIGDDRLSVARRSSPRQSVPAGAVALADAYSAVYPRVTPGGWQLIGRTDAALWSLDRDPPALIQPGNRVQFRAVRELLEVSSKSRPIGGAADADEQETRTGLLVVQPGVQTTVQDLGRPGFAHLGVAGAGALDRGALRRANRLVGNGQINGQAAAVLENALGGLILEAHSEQVLAVTGAHVSLSISGANPREAPRETPIALHAGERLTLGAPQHGVRSYVAVRGGFDEPLHLGSRSTDSMSGIGPAPLLAGTELRVLPAPPSSVVGAAESPSPPPDAVTELRYLPGPRADWFSSETLADFSQTDWSVTAQSNRIGLRLDGPALTRSHTGELPSEGTVAGAIQLPASGLPVLFLADHPVTGGYPVLGVVLHVDLDRAAQLPAGARIRFVPLTPGTSPADADTATITTVTPTSNES